VRSHSLDAQLSLRLSALLVASLDLKDSESQELISSLTAELLEAAVGGGAVRSPLQIELILRSLSRSSAKPQVKALL